MEKITSLARQLQSDARLYPELRHLTLTEGEMFAWNHTASAITYDPHATQAEALLMHEYGHALLGHVGYAHDIDLVKIERAAWDKALEIAHHYHVSIPKDLVEESLDTYRDWLHDRSLCPSCEATGIQTAPQQYRCLACGTSWRVNEARTCALRRYRTKKHPL